MLNQNCHQLNGLSSLEFILTESFWHCQHLAFAYVQSKISCSSLTCKIFLVVLYFSPLWPQHWLYDFVIRDGWRGMRGEDCDIESSRMRYGEFFTGASAGRLERPFGGKQLTDANTMISRPLNGLNINNQTKQSLINYFRLQIT